MYVTDDLRVRALIGEFQRQRLGVEEFKAKVRALPPQEKAHRGYLDWEINEALKEARRAA